MLWLNAGVGRAPVSADAECVEWGFGVNVLGVIWSMQAFWPLMERVVARPRRLHRIKRGDGVTRGRLPHATKHGTFAVAEALRAELGAKEYRARSFARVCSTPTSGMLPAPAPSALVANERMDPATSGWRAAQDPVVMWPHIAERMEPEAAI